MGKPSLLRAGWALRRHLFEKPEPYRVAARQVWTFIGRSLKEVGVVENFRARFNRAYGIAAHGYSDGAYCVLPSSHT